MENDDFFIAKKTGMTITKAWILFVSMFLLYFLIGAIQGVIQASKGAELGSMDLLSSSLVINCLVSTIMCVIAYFVNIKELPRFEKPSIQAFLIALAVGVLLRFALSIVEEIPFKLVTDDVLKEMMSIGPLLLFLPALVLMIFQVGFIGHGLLRNYGFATALLTTVLVSIVNFELKSIISMMVLTGFGLLVYYRTSSFWLYLTLILPYFSMDIILSSFFDFGLFGFNNFRHKLIQNDTTYFALLGLSFVLLLIAIRYYVSKQPQDWKRHDELPEF